MDKNEDGVISMDEFMATCSAVSWRLNSFVLLNDCILLIICIAILFICVYS